MISRRSLPPALISVLPVILPAIAILIARAATSSDWAAARPGIAALLFAWIVVDALAFGLLAKAPGHKPTLYQVVAVLALSSIVVLVGAATPVRAVYIAMPQVLAAAGLTITLFLGWSAVRLATGWHVSGSLPRALEELLPPMLFRFAVAEIRTLRLALLSWNEPAQVPAGARAFTYHTYLTPMIATFLALQLIELAVVHLLLMFWNPTVAWVLFGLSLWGVLWTMALLKSFRLFPVLIEGAQVRARSGMIHDLAIPADAVGRLDTPFSKEELERKSVLNLAILSSPNVSIRLKRPLPLRTFFGGERVIEGVALRLDDSASFIAELKRAMAAGK